MAEPTLSGKCGPGCAPAGAAVAAARLDAYERIVRAVGSAGPEGPPRAPVFYLSEGELEALFAPRQLEVLVLAPLKAPEGACPPDGQARP